MVLRVLLLLTGLLRATEPAPRCETSQETLGKDNHPKSPLSPLFPSTADEQRKRLRLQDKRGSYHPYLEMGVQLLGNLQHPCDENGVVLRKHGWESRQQCGSETEKQARKVRECKVFPSLSFKAMCRYVFLSNYRVPCQ